MKSINVVLTQMCSRPGVLTCMLPIYGTGIKQSSNVLFGQHMLGCTVPPLQPT